MLCLLHAVLFVKLINLITQFVEAFIVLAAGRLKIRTRRLPTASANVAVSLLSSSGPGALAASSSDSPLSAASCTHEQISLSVLSAATGKSLPMAT